MANCKVVGEDFDFVNMFQISAKAKSIVSDFSKQVEAEVRGRVMSAANRGYATGDLAGSISATPVKENEYGIYSVVRTRGYGGKNNTALPLQLAVLEHNGAGIREGAASAVRSQFEQAVEDAIDEVCKDYFL